MRTLRLWSFGKPIKIDFENWTKENLEAIDNSIWMIIKQHYIPCDVWINHLKNKSNALKMMVNFVWMKYDANLKDRDLKRIKQVEEIYDQISRSISL